MYNDDFDIDEGLDLDQFDYKAEPVDPRYFRDDYDSDSRFDADDDRYMSHDERGYSRSRPYVAEFDDNIVFKSQPEYETTPDDYARPFSTLPRLGAYRESSRSIKPNRDRYTSYEPRKEERRQPRESFRSHQTYTESASHYQQNWDEKYRSRRPTSHYEPSRDDRYHSQRSSSRYDPPSKDDKFRYSQPVAHSATSDKYSMTRDWLFKEKFERNTTRKSKREKVRKFPPPEPNAPAIPPPDYDDDDTTGVLYVPTPDYR